MIRRAATTVAALIAGSIPLSTSPGSVALAASTGASAEALVVIPRPATPTGLSYFKLETAAGSDTQVGEIELLNRGKQRLVVSLRAVRGETLGTLGSTYAAPGTRRTGAARWLHFASETVAIGSGRHTEVPVSVAVPRTARSGDYLSGVSVLAEGQAHRAVPSLRGAGAQVTVRYAIGVETVVPGPRRPLIHFLDASLSREPSALTFQLHAANTGNVTLQDVHGEVLVRRGSHTVLSRPLGPGTFVAGTSIAYPVPAPEEHPAEGTRYQVTASLRYEGGIARMQTSVVFGHRAAVAQARYSPRHQDHGGGAPWWIYLALGAALAYGLAMTAVLIRRRASAPPVAGGPAGQG